MKSLPERGNYLNAVLPLWKRILYTNAIDNPVCCSIRLQQEHNSLQKNQHSVVS